VAFTSSTASSDGFMYSYYYGTNGITDINDTTAAVTTIYGDSTYVVTSPIAYPSLTTATSGGSIASGTYYCCFTYVTQYGETLAGPITTVTPGVGTTNTVTVAALASGTLSSGVTGVNFYMTTSTSGGSRAWQETALTLSGTGTSAKTITSFSISAQPPQFDPPCPVTLTYSATTGTLFAINNTYALSISYLELQNSSSSGSSVGFQSSYSGKLSLSNTIVSGFDYGYYALSQSGMYLTSCQDDNSTSAVYLIGLSFANLAGVNCYFNTYSINAHQSSMACPNAFVYGSSSYAFIVRQDGYISAVLPVSTFIQAYDCGAVSTPSACSSGATNSYGDGSIFQNTSF